MFLLFSCALLSIYCTTADLVKLDLVKIFLRYLGDLGVKMTGRLSETLTMLRPRGAAGSGGGDRVKMPASPSG